MIVFYCWDSTDKYFTKGYPQVAPWQFNCSEGTLYFTRWSLAVLTHSNRCAPSLHLFYYIFFPVFNYFSILSSSDVIVEVWKWRKQLLNQHGKCLWRTNGKTMNNFSGMNRNSERLQGFRNCVSYQSFPKVTQFSLFFNTVLKGWDQTIFFPMNKKLLQEGQVSIKTAAYPALDDETSFPIPICKERPRLDTANRVI